jgi:hypothetical protein
VALFAAATAFVVFCIVQDRVTAAAARQYVRLHRQAAAGAAPASTPALDELMRPAVRQSVRYGLLSGAAAGAVVLAGGALTARRTRRE